ncbi:hypothetical protein GVN21_18905 [Caulobacter sp. SLTY]|uniref:hypothetical protein n=1 Tax=Caulobacter sp. SLTY TaxID=2683262 RepID=UPI0014121C27|nr:hypothetical protein [Caulobacter sp. SLTY]NBB17435.1 hypothetical protein [Caulobacter sp. SLTY]
MATRTVERTDGVTTEREVIRDGAQPVYVERRSGGSAGIIIGIALLALVAVVAFFFLAQANRNEAIRTEAVTDAAASVASSASSAAENVSGAAERAADSVAPAAE